MAEIQSAPSQWPRLKDVSDAAGLRVGIVVARFNDLVTAKLLSGCLDCLKRHGVDVPETSPQLDVAWVPGPELPIVAQQMARSGQYQVLIPGGGDPRGHALFRRGGGGSQQVHCRRGARHGSAGDLWCVDHRHDAAGAGRLASRAIWAGVTDWRRWRWAA